MRQRQAKLVLLACCAISLAGCQPSASESPGQFWINGLSLPSGSTIVFKEQAPVVESEAARIRDILSGSYAVEIKRTIDRKLVVNFDCPAGWEAVVAHCGEQLEKLGYAELAQTERIRQSTDPRVIAVFSGTRMYLGRDYLVELSNSLGMPVETGTGQYMLCVDQLK